MLNNGKEYVRLQGTQNIGGIKKFTQFPYTPQALPVEDYQVVNKAYADNSTHLIGDSWRLYANGATIYLQYNNAGTWTNITSWSFP